MNPSVIYKYPLLITDYQLLKMPQGAKLLCVQVQRGVPCLWALHRTNHPEKQRQIRVIGTGHLISEPPESLQYIGSVQLAAGELVFHVFDLGEVD